MKVIPPIHPGEILYEDFMEPSNISAYKLAKGMGVPPIRVSEIIRGKRAITADTAIKLGFYFGISAQFWLNLQSHYDLEVARDKLDAKQRFNIKVFPMPKLSKQSKKST